MDNIGGLISEFVAERVDKPGEGERHLWSEAVSVGLFSVAVEVAMRLEKMSQGPEIMQRTMARLIDSVVSHASQWVNERLSEEEYEKERPPIAFDVSKLLHSRITTYFNEAILVICDSMASEIARTLQRKQV